MKKFILLRHCKAEMSGEDHLRKLDSEGIVQSVSVCEKLENMVKKDVKIYSSPFIRAVETVKPLADKLKIDIIQSDELKEIKIGKSEKLTKHEIINEMWKAARARRPRRARARRA